MPGFSRLEQDRLAALVLAQRGTLKKVEDKLDTLISTETVLALRLAVILRTLARMSRSP